MKLVRGVGYNSGGKHELRIDGKSTTTYGLWVNMLNRCYSSEYHERVPTYIGCTVADEWLDFQVFAEWVFNYKYKGDNYQLDKDLLIEGNKIYSPETCCLVPVQLNTLLISATAARGEHPQGVYFNKPRGKYLSRLSVGGRSRHLGYFKCPQKAHQVYVVAKEAHVKHMADLWLGNIDPKVYIALMDWRVPSQTEGEDK